MNHSLSKIDERDTDAESYLEKIARIIKVSTDIYFPIKQVKRFEPRKAWVKNRIKRHTANRDKHYQLWIKTKSNEDYEKYKKMKSIWKFKKRSEMKFKLKLTTILRKNFSDL